MYKGGRPNRVARFLNGIWCRMAAAGMAPKQLSTLEVRGRRSGDRISFPVVVADYGEERYPVAMLGEGVNWVANVRAARGEAVLRHGRGEGRVRRRPRARARSSATMGDRSTWALVVALIGETSTRLVTRDRAECERLAAGLIHLRDAVPSSHSARSPRSPFRSVRRQATPRFRIGSDMAA